MTNSKPQPKGTRVTGRELNRFSIQGASIYDHLDQADVLIRVDGDWESEADREQYVNALAARLQAPAPAPTGDLIELAAKQVFQTLPGWCGQPWDEGGNSLKQDEARRYARVALAAVPCAAVGEQCENCGGKGYADAWTARDAARYRWLRGDDSHGFGSPRWACWQVQVWGGNPLHWQNVAGVELDAAIDSHVPVQEKTDETK